jgi:hypothetical protein
VHPPLRREEPEGVLPRDVKVALFMPASSPLGVLDDLESKPLRSAQRRYMRASISAQSCESTPPAPEFMVRMASPSSYSPAKSLATSCSSSTRSTRLSSSPTSERRSPSSSRARAISSESERLPRSPREAGPSPVPARSGPRRFFCLLRIAQKPGLLISSPSPATSCARPPRRRTPPAPRGVFELECLASKLGH